MRLLSYSTPRGDSFGAAVGDRVVDIPSLAGARWPTLRAVLDDDALDDVRALVADAPATIDVTEVALLPPIVDPRKIVCVGVNYRDHRDESGLTEAPEHPTVFTRFADSHVGHDRPIVHPRNTAQLDYEGEVAIVIGRPLAGDDDDGALRAGIAGLSGYNDVSVRDWQLHNSQWTPGKNFTGVGAFGPWLVTIDEFSDLPSTVLETRVNGELVQQATLADLVFDFTAILRYIVGFTTLAPGDVIVTGTPGGVGLVADPPRFLVPGDVAEVFVSGVGTLRNEIVAAP